MDTQKIVQEAKSRIIWGQNPEDVRRFLLQEANIGDAQADGLIKSFVKERNSHARSVAIEKIVMGGLLLLVPILYLAISYFFIGVIYTKIFGLTCIPGAYGLFKLTDGIILMLKPSSKINE